MGPAGKKINQGVIHSCLAQAPSLQGTPWLLINTVQPRKKQMPQLLTDAHSLSPAPHLLILPVPPMLAHLQPTSQAITVTQVSIRNRDWLHSHQQTPEKGYKSQTPHASASTSASAQYVSSLHQSPLTFALKQSIFSLSHRLKTHQAHLPSSADSLTELSMSPALPLAGPGAW